ncbi:MAG TPA: NAD(P)-dependent alcohol dehydrogenase [Anaerolinea sp.]|nr:NAD(P)-dependent alcohol dehydrogenase [Anaerolinea sp.]
MKAIVYTEYGPADVLHLQEVEKPSPKDNEVLIRIHATSVTAADCNARGFTFVPPGFGFISRLVFGLRKPRQPILGTELSGEIVEVGKDVRLFKVGEQVFGVSLKYGAYAEYICMPEDDRLVTKPANLSCAEAASIPFGATTALYFLRDLAKLQPGQKVLIIGASGCTGVYAVQLAKYYGAEVTGVCSTRNLELVRSLGADHVIDYTREDCTRNGRTYDVILDMVPGKSSFARYRSSLQPNGLYLAGAGGLGVFAQMAWTGLTGGRKVLAGVAPDRVENLVFLKGLLEAGKLKPVIDRFFSLEQTAEAHRYADTGHKRGSVVITVAAEG